MKLNNIAKKLKDYGFVESDDREGRMVHPENTDFVVELYYDDECDEIEIGDFRNYVSIPVYSIKTFGVNSKPDGIEIDIGLNDNSCEIHLFCAFDK